MEKEIIGKLPFLDVLLDTSGHSINTSVFCKKTYTALLTNYFSFTPFRYKIGLIKTLFDRAFKINNSWTGFHEDSQHIKSTLQKNSFPINLIDNILKSYLDLKHGDDNSAVSSELPTRYYKLPFIGSYSNYYTQIKLNKILTKCCKNISIKLIFIPFKIGSMFQGSK